MSSTGTYSAPRTMAAGTTGASTDWNSYVRDNMNAAVNRVVLSLNSTTTPSRDIGVAYQNTTPGVMWLVVASACTSASTPQYCDVFIQAGVATTSLIAVASQRSINTASSAGALGVACVTAVIPAWYYYTVYQITGSTQYWLEYRIS